MDQNHRKHGLKRRLLDPSQVSDFLVQGWDLRICISNKFSCHADAAFLRTALWEPLIEDTRIPSLMRNQKNREVNKETQSKWDDGSQRLIPKWTDLRNLILKDRFVSSYARCYFKPEFLQEQLNSSEICVSEHVRHA